LSQSQENYKEELTKMIESLNDAIDKSTGIISKKNIGTIKSLEHILSVRQKEQANAKNQTKIYRQQLELIQNKANDRCSSEK
jgi:hypothetical protein